MKTPTSADIKQITSLEGNITVLNTGGHFYSVHEPTDAVWANELRNIPRNSEGLRHSNPLVELQISQHERGFTQIQPVQAIANGGYWYLRNTSNLGETFPAGRGQYNSVGDAVAAATRWYLEDPAKREVTMRADVYKTLVQEEAQTADLSQHSENWRKSREADAPAPTTAPKLKN